jgi:predicted 3-demethylubiquinone-9 3-methyltransferase (glyoxalase superfamily)
VLGGITKTASLLSSGNILGAGLSALTTYEKIKSGRAVRGVNEEIIGIAKDAIKAGTNNLGATSKPGVSFPKNLKQTRTNNTQISKAVGKSVQTSNAVFLNPKQAKIYLDNNFDAKQKFAKFTSFRIDANLDPNDVDDQWNQLTDEEQNSYLSNATNIISTLIESKQLQYQVNKDEYKKFVEAPLAEQTVATVNLNDSGLNKGLSAGTITGSKGYTYNG